MRNPCTELVCADAVSVRPHRVTAGCGVLVSCNVLDLVPGSGFVEVRRSAEDSDNLVHAHADIQQKRRGSKPRRMREIDALLKLCDRMSDTRRECARTDLACYLKLGLARSEGLFHRTDIVCQPVTNLGWDLKRQITLYAIANRLLEQSSELVLC